MLGCGSISHVSTILRTERRRFLILESKSYYRWEVATADTDQFGTRSCSEPGAEAILGAIFGNHKTVLGGHLFPLPE